MVCACFVMHRPTSVHKIEATFLDKLMDLFLHLFSLTLPPHRPKFHLNLSETLLLVGHELDDIGVNNVLNVGLLRVLVRPHEVLVGRLEPAHVVVRVGDDVHVQMLSTCSEVCLHLGQILAAVLVLVLELGQGFAAHRSHKHGLHHCRLHR